MARPAAATTRANNVQTAAAICCEHDLLNGQKHSKLAQAQARADASTLNAHAEVGAHKANVHMKLKMQEHEPAHAPVLHTNECELCAKRAAAHYTRAKRPQCPNNSPFPPAAGAHVMSAE